MVMRALAPTNPFASARALEHSSYGRYHDGALAVAGRPATALEEFVHDSFRALVLNPKFACVAAKSAVRNDTYRMGHYHAMGDAGALDGLAHDLFTFTQDRLTMDGFSTFVATFDEPPPATELDFERRLWSLLQNLHRRDREHHRWDGRVSADPESPDFSFSFGGHAFFVVGLHPASSRFTRRFAFPTLVFNAHEQFEALREQGRFERMQQVIRARDVALQGTPNANLADFGDRSEARQYAGRAVEGDWRCPFHVEK